MRKMVAILAVACLAAMLVAGPAAAAKPERTMSYAVCAVTNSTWQVEVTWDGFKAKSINMSAGAEPTGTYVNYAGNPIPIPHGQKSPYRLQVVSEWFSAYQYLYLQVTYSEKGQLFGLTDGGGTRLISGIPSCG